MKKPLILLAAVALLALTVFSADLSGTWNTVVTTSAGNGTPTFVLKQDGEKLTGTFTNQFGTSPLTGTIKDGDVKIEVVLGGTKTTYVGKVDGGGTKIEGTCDYGGQVSGTFTATKK
jgi:hypothetical protein